MEKYAPILGMWEEVFPTEMFNYLKFILYGTDDKKVIEEKDQALKSLFAGIHEMSKKNLNKAIQLIQYSLDSFIQTHDDLNKAFSQFFLGELYQMQENVGKAKELYEKAYEVFKKKGNFMALNVEQRIKDIQK